MLKRPGTTHAITDCSHWPSGRAGARTTSTRINSRDLTRGSKVPARLADTAATPTKHAARLSRPPITFDIPTRTQNPSISIKWNALISRDGCASSSCEGSSTEQGRTPNAAEGSTLGRRCRCTGSGGEARWPSAMRRLTVHICEPRCSSGTLARPRIRSTRVRSVLQVRRRWQRRPLVPGAFQPAGLFGLYGLGLFLGQHQRHIEELVEDSSRGASKW
jgi:hypothetical protein